MRLFLASFRLNAKVRELAELAGPRARVAVTANALDNLVDFPREKWVDEELRVLAATGLSPCELDLRDHYAQPETLASALAAVDLAWATGGNAFVLRDAMSRSRLDALVLDRVRDNSLAYGGYSAGACICGPTLHGIELLDDVTAVPHPVWDGLGFVDFSVAPHYGSNHAESQTIERLVDYFRANGMPYRTLRDGQAIVVRDGSARTIEV